MATINPNFSVNKDATLRDVNATSLQVAGNLTVGGSIAPGTFTNRVVTLVDAAAAAEIGGGPLTAAQSGTTFLVGALSVGAQTLTLPPAEVGVNYTIQFLADPVQNLTITCDATVAENLAGLLNMNGGVVTAKAAATTLVCNGGALALGDNVTIQATANAAAAVVWQVVATSVAAAGYT